MFHTPLALRHHHGRLLHHYDDGHLYGGHLYDYDRVHLYGGDRGHLYGVHHPRHGGHRCHHLGDRQDCSSSA